MKTVALLDTGISIKNDKINRLTVEKNMDFTKQLIGISTDYGDNNGHGTACAKLITQNRNDVTLLSLKVLNDDKCGKVSQLYQALQYLLDVEVDIIHMSLSFLEHINKKELESVCDELSKQGKILVASTDNRTMKSYPAIYPSVIGVRGYAFENHSRFYFNKYAEIQAIGDSSPVLIEWEDKKITILGGTSKAAALITNKLIEGDTEGISYLEKKSIDIHEIKEINEYSYEVQRMNLDNRRCDRKILKQIVDIVPCTRDKKKYLYEKELSDPFFELKTNDYIDIVQELLVLYDFRIHEEVFAQKILQSIYSLEEYIRGAKI